MRSIIFFSILAVCSCSQSTERIVEVSPEANRAPEKINGLIINEYSPKSNTLSEFNEEADWIELYNSTDSLLIIGKDRWSISDDPDDLQKFMLPGMEIRPHGHVVIWCDGRNLVERDIHTNFKLSGKGEEILLSFDGVYCDRVRFDNEVKKSRSYGRVEDGADEWTEFRSPSPGTSNQSADNYAEAME